MLSVELLLLFPQRKVRAMTIQQHAGTTVLEKGRQQARCIFWLQMPVVLQTHLSVHLASEACRPAEIC